MSSGGVSNTPDTIFVVFDFIFFSAKLQAPWARLAALSSGKPVSFSIPVSKKYRLLCTFGLAVMKSDDHDKRKCPSHVLHGECQSQLLPVRDALDILNGKWKLQIILCLTFGKKRFRQIQREIPGITPKMLSKELKDLEVNGLASRHVYDSVPVTVEYELTRYGRTLKPLIVELHKWGAAHRKRIQAGSFELLEGGGV